MTWLKIAVFSLSLLIAIFGTVARAENTVLLSAEQIKDLGISLGKLTVASQIPVLYAPAKVVIPPNKDYIVSASQAGLITQLTASVGDKVTKGQVLAHINSADLLALQSQYLQANRALALATATYNRDKKLLQDGIIANRREQETLSQYNAALLTANEAKQHLQIAGMSAIAIEQLSQSQRLNSELDVHAPITGSIIERIAVAGTRIDNLAPIYRVANLDELWLEINIPQERIGTIKIGDSVLIENTHITAQINLLGESVNADNQTLLARAIINGTQASIRAGQKINIQIIQPATQAVFSVPNSAIAQNDGKSYVFVRQASGFDVRPITLIGKQSEESMISGEFTGAEDIAIKGAVALKANWLGLGSAE